MSKARVRYTRKGWYAYWMRFNTGTMVAGKPIVIPDQYGALQRDVWVGPYATAGEAIDATSPQFPKAFVAAAGKLAVDRWRAEEKLTPRNWIGLLAPATKHTQGEG